MTNNFHKEQRNQTVRYTTRFLETLERDKYLVNRRRPEKISNIVHLGLREARVNNLRMIKYGMSDYLHGNLMWTKVSVTGVIGKTSVMKRILYRRNGHYRRTITVLCVVYRRK